MLENVIQIMSGRTINAAARVKIQNNIVCAKKNYIWNPATRSRVNGKYLANVIDN